MTPIHPRAAYVLKMLAASPGPVNRWHLVDQLTPGAEDDGVLRVYIRRIRKALGYGAVRTIRGKGYLLTYRGRIAYERMAQIS